MVTQGGGGTVADATCEADLCLPLSFLFFLPSAFFSLVLICMSPVSHGPISTPPKCVKAV